jgi:ABC-type transport system involved in multi-copper enzyme maturation permease subunit
MKIGYIIFQRELRAYFDSSIAYIFAIVFLLLTCGIFMNDFFLVSVADMGAYFAPLPYLMILFIPAIAMRLWAEERKDNTYELLATLPIKRLELILGKYFASFVFFLITLAGTLPIVVMLYILGSPDTGKIFASYLGVISLGALYLAISCFLSSISRDQIVAYLISVLALSLYYVSGNEMVASVLDGLWPSIQLGSFLRDSFSAVPHYESFTRGIVDFQSLVYFLSIIVLALTMNNLILKRDRY